VRSLYLCSLEEFSLYILLLTVEQSGNWFVLFTTKKAAYSGPRW